MQINIPSVTAECPLCSRRQDVDLPPALTRSFVARCDACLGEFAITRVQANVVYDFPVNPHPTVSVDVQSAAIGPVVVSGAQAKATPLLPRTKSG